MLELLNRKGEDFLSLGRGGLGQKFVPRADGYFDFFPKGMRKSGYRVDGEARDRIMHLERGLDGLFMALIFVIGLVISVVRPLLDAAAPLGELWLILAGGVVVGFVMLVSRRGVGRMTSELLRELPVVNMTEEGYRQLMIQRWKELPRRRLLQNLLWILAPAVLLTGVAMGGIPVLAWQRFVAIGLAVLFWAGILQMGWEVIRVWYWIRVLR